MKKRIIYPWRGIIAGFLFMVLAVANVCAADGVSFRVVNNWISGFQGEIKITNNTSQAYDGWNIEFDFPYDITSSWGGEKVSREYSTYTFKSFSWNAKLQPGQSVTIGFCAVPGGESIIPPSNIKLNGQGESGGNNPPAAKDDSVSLQQDSSIKINVLANDTDPDGDNLTITGVTAPANGTVDNLSNSIIYYPHTGFTGTDSFSYTVTDTNGESDSAIVNVTVNSVTPPSDSVDIKITSWGGPAFNGNVTITNNTDMPFENWTLEFDFPHNITNIWSAVIADHTGNHYVLNNASWNGKVPAGATVSFGFSGTFNGAESDPANIILNGQGTEPDKPVAANDTAEIDTNTTACIDVMANDTGNGIHIAGISDPANGTVIIDDGKIVYSPDNNYAGTDTFSYTIEDSNGQQATATVTMTVEEPPPPAPPVAADDTATTFIDTAKTIDATNNDSDPAGGEITIAEVTTPANGTTVLNDNKIVYTPNSGFAGTDTFSYTIANISGLTAVGTVTVNVREKADINNVIVGYWHNWDSASSPYIRLKDVNEKYNVINVSFAEPASSDMNMKFAPDNNTTEADFISDIQYLQSSGKKVLISIGGANAHIRIDNETKKNNFVNSMKAIINKYGFDGLDIDFEGGALNVESSDFTKPTSALTVNTIAAIKELITHYKGQGGDFWITAAPEVAYLQGAMSSYGGIWGAYIPLLYALGDDLTYVTPQLYNTGSVYGLDGKIYAQSSADFIVAMTEALTKGMNINGKIFKLRPDQVGFGLPATPSAAPAGGYLAPAEVKKALDYLTKGESFGGSYVLQEQEGYPDLRGIMTWSVNWDKTTNGGTVADEFVENYYDYFFGAQPENINPTVGFAAPVDGETIILDTLQPVNIAVNADDSDGSIVSTFIEVEGKIYPGSSVNWTPSEFGTFTLKATATDDKGAVVTKTINVTIENSGGYVAPEVSFLSHKDGDVIQLENLAAIDLLVMASDPDGNISKITISVDGKLFNGTSAAWTPDAFGDYTVTATAIDNEGNIAVASIGLTIAEYLPVPPGEKKQIIGYFTQWDAWKAANNGYPMQGVCNQLNIDYEKYTILNFSFFGVAKDGSLHGADFRNKQIYVEGTEQEPAELLNGDIYSSWDYWLLYGELDLLWSFDARATEAGFVKEGSNWYNTKTGLRGPMPIPIPKENGAPGLFKLCKDNGVKLMASIGGWSMCKHFPEMAADPVKKQKFIDDCKRLMTLGFDGIDIDWEYPGPFSGMNYTGSTADYANFAALMKDIRAAIGPDKIITTALSCAPNKVQNLEWNELNKYVDYYNIMSYDINGGWSDNTGHNSPLYAPEGELSWDNTFKYLTNVLGISPSKINMGLGFYGRGVVTDGAAFLGAPTVKVSRNVSPDGPVITAADYTNWGAFEGVPNYAYIMQNRNGWAYHWDDYAKVPYMTKDNYFLSFDDETSIGLKAQYVNDNNLGGVIVWHVFGDLDVGNVEEIYANKLPYCPNTTAPLLNVIHNAFNK